MRAELLKPWIIGFQTQAFGEHTQSLLLFAKLPMQVGEQEIRFDVLGIVANRFAKRGNGFAGFAGASKGVAAIEVSRAEIGLNFSCFAKYIRGFEKAILVQERGTKLKETLR